jgi:hypothetical protein
MHARDEVHLRATWRLDRHNASRSSGLSSVLRGPLREKPSKTRIRKDILDE